MSTLSATATYHRRAVKRAQKTGDASVILAACDAADDAFRAVGYPDDWTFIQRAADDAAMGARYY